MKKQKCAVCGELFKTTGNGQKYCTTACKARFWNSKSRKKPQPEIKCAMCDKIFVKQYNMTKYCSDKCRDSARLESRKRRLEEKRAKRERRFCKICGSEITHMQKTAQICRSKKCFTARKHQHEKRKQKKIAWAECGWCGKKFKKRTNYHKYCTTDCARSAKLEKNRMSKYRVEAADWDYIPRADDFSQKKYEEIQKMLQSPNGRHCKYKHCKNDLVGNDRMYCKQHQNNMKERENFTRCDNDWIYDGPGKPELFTIKMGG